MVKIHFLNVGKGNCTIIDFPSGNLSIIDIDDSCIKEDENVLTNPIDYLDNNFLNRSIFRFILTHPDMDHMSGLNELAKRQKIWNFWDTEHQKNISSEEWTGSPYKKEDWDRYQEFRNSKDSPKCLKNLRLQTADCCWVQDGIKILSPSRKLVQLSNSLSETDSQKYNHLSYVLMIEYKKTKVLLGGDASKEVWQDILKDCGKHELKANIFLAPHHGSKNSIHEETFEAIEPEYVVISVRRGTAYEYDYYNELASEQVFSTKYFGNIILDINENGIYEINLEKKL